MKTFCVSVCTLVFSLAPATLAQEEAPDMESIGRVVLDFASPETASWRAVNDGVMGGLSQSGLRLTQGGTAVFAGNVSLENNGGFASVRAWLGEVDLSAYDRLAVRVRGDGQRYRLRLRTDDRFDGIAYQASFDAALDEWQEVEIPLSSFVPTFRGRTLRDVPPLNTAKISQIGFMIADKQEGRFRLEIAWVRAVKNADPHDGTDDEE
jgi:monofunctional biosynthetic peptidoglycan transglycosylase